MKTISPLFQLDTNGENGWQKLGRVGKAKGLKGEFWVRGETHILLQPLDWTEIRIDNQIIPLEHIQSKRDHQYLFKPQSRDRTWAEQQCHKDVWVPIQGSFQLFEYTFSSLKTLLHARLQVGSENIDGFFRQLIPVWKTRPNLIWSIYEEEIEIPLHPSIIKWDNQNALFSVSSDYWESLRES